MNLHAYSKTPTPVARKDQIILDNASPMGSGVMVLGPNPPGWLITVAKNIDTGFANNSVYITRPIRNQINSCAPEGKIPQI